LRVAPNTGRPTNATEEENQMRYPVSRALSVLGVMLIAGCAAPPPAQVAAPPGYLDEARGIAATVPVNLLTVLTAELNRSGPAGAIEV